jgi:hypothetical protein
MRAAEDILGDVLAEPAFPDRQRRNAEWSRAEHPQLDVHLQGRGRDPQRRRSLLDCSPREAVRSNAF